MFLMTKIKKISAKELLPVNNIPEILLTNINTDSKVRAENHPRNLKYLYLISIQTINKQIINKIITSIIIISHIVISHITVIKQTISHQTVTKITISKKIFFSQVRPNNQQIKLQTLNPV